MPTHVLDLPRDRRDLRPSGSSIYACLTLPAAASRMRSREVPHPVVADQHQDPTMRGAQVVHHLREEHRVDAATTLIIEHVEHGALHPSADEVVGECDRHQRVGVRVRTDQRLARAWPAVQRLRVCSSPRTARPWVLRARDAIAGAAMTASWAVASLLVVAFVPVRQDPPRRGFGARVTAYAAPRHRCESARVLIAAWVARLAASKTFRSGDGDSGRAVAQGNGSETSRQFRGPCSWR